MYHVYRLWRMRPCISDLFQKFINYKFNSLQIPEVALLFVIGGALPPSGDGNIS